MTTYLTHLFPYSKGRIEKYQGGRTRIDIVQFLIDATGPPVTGISCDLLSEKVNSQQLSMVYFGEPEGKTYTDVFYEVASESKKIKFYNVREQGCAEKLGVQSSAKSPIVFFRNFDDPISVYEEDMTKSSVKDWFLDLQIPIMVHLTKDTA